MPCTFMEYKVTAYSVLDIMQTRPLFRLQIIEKSKYPLPVSNLAPTFGSDSIQVMREEEAFSFGSLVADCGGVLGLFIGFNFIMIWDWIVIALSSFISSLFHNKTET